MNEKMDFSDLVADLNLEPSLGESGRLQTDYSLIIKLESVGNVLVMVSDKGVVLVYPLEADFMTIDQLSQILLDLNTDETFSRIRTLSPIITESIDRILWVHKSERGEYKIFPFSLLAKI